MFWNTNKVDHKSHFIDQFSQDEWVSISIGVLL